jgi:adenylate cyclase
MPVQEHEQPDRQGSASSGNSWISQATVRNSDGTRQDNTASDGRNAEPFPGTLTDK